MARNRGSETATVSWVHDGVAGQQNVEPGKVYYLPYKLTPGKKVSEVYESVQASFPTSGKTVTFDVNQTASSLITVFEFTDAETTMDEALVTVVNLLTTGVTLSYEGGGAIDSIDMDPEGAYDLPTPVTKGDTLGSVYNFVNALIDGNVVFEADLSQVINNDTSIFITVEPTETVTVDFEAYIGTPAPSSQTLNVGDLVTEPTAPAIAQADIPQGYTGDGSSNGWYNDTVEWNFQNDTVSENMTLKTYYNVYRTVAAYDEENGTQVDTVYAYYPFSATAPITEDYIVEPSNVPTDPQGQGRTFAGWAYKVGGVETQLIFATYFPDGGLLMTAGIPTTVTEIYALWEAPAPENFEFNLQSTIQQAPSSWVAMTNNDAGSAAFSPYISATTYGTDFHNMVDAIQNMNMGICTVSQNDNTYNFDTFNDMGTEVEMNDAEETIYLTMGGDYVDSHDKIFLTNPTGVTLSTAADPSTGTSGTIVLDSDVTMMNASYLIDTYQDTQNIFLAQDMNPNCMYVCDFSKVVTANDSASLIFEIGTASDPDYQSLQINYTWDSDVSEWLFGNVAKSGFSDVVTE